MLERKQTLPLRMAPPAPPSSSLNWFWPVDINDRGEVVGIGSTRSGEAHAFLLVPNNGDVFRATTAPL
jgi:probable HAF family extracellular repeat protein